VRGGPGGGGGNVRIAGALRLALDDMPLRDQQLATLNRALSDEVRRHAATRQALNEARQQLRVALTLCWINEALGSAEVMRNPQPVRADASHWKPGPKRQRSMVRFPLIVGERTGLAAIIQEPLRLKSGAMLDPASIAARRGDRAAVFPDSSWLVLSELVRNAGEFVPRADLEIAVFGRDGGGSVRSSIHRARLTLASVGAEADLERTDGHVGAWRLLLAEVPGDF
jgi:hypothetical protein